MAGHDPTGSVTLTRGPTNVFEYYYFPFPDVDS